VKLLRGWLAALLGAEVVSSTGSAMTYLALPWFVLASTGSASRMSFVVAAELLGVAVFGLPGGAVLHRLGARRTMILCDAARAPLVALVPVLHWTGHLRFSLLLAIVFLAGAFFPPYFAAQRVIVPELLGEDATLVTKANAFLQAATRVTILVGPAAAGLLIGFVGAPTVLVVDAATFLASFALVALFVPPRREAAPDEDDGRGLLAGIRFLLRDPLLRVWSVGIVVVDSSWQALFLALPVLAFTHFGHDAKLAGWMLAGWGLGAVLGNAAAYRLSGRDPVGLTSTGMLVESLPLWLLALSLPATGYVSVMLAAGVLNGLVNPSLHATLTLRTPPSVRAKASTAVLTLSSIGAPVALAGAGPALDSYGPRPVFLAVALVQTVARAAIAVAGFRVRGRMRAATAAS